MVTVMTNVFLIAAILIVSYCLTVGLTFALPLGAHLLAPRSFSRDGLAKPSFLSLNIIIWFVAAAAGGALIGYLAPWHPFVVALFYACGLFAIIVLIALRVPGSAASLNYDVMVASNAALGTVAGCFALQLLHLHLRLIF